MRVKLPARTSCNKILDQRFETRAKTPVRRLLEAKGDAELTAAEAQAVGEWLLKTWLFLSHPRAVYRHPTFGGYLWEHGDEDLYSWTVTGQPAPPGLSVWASKSRPVHAEDGLAAAIGRPGSDEGQALRQRMAVRQLPIEFQPQRTIDRAIDAPTLTLD